MDETKAIAEHGITFGEPKVDLEKLLGWKNKVVGKLTGGLSGIAKSRKVDVRARLRRVFSSRTTSRSKSPKATVRTRRVPKSVVQVPARPSSRSGSQSVRLRTNGNELPRRSARGRFDRRAAPALENAETDAGDRRRHHRPGNGHRVFEALGAKVWTSSKCSTAQLMQGCRPRPLPAVWEKMN
jgi:hypothetical protein